MADEVSSLLSEHGAQVAIPPRRRREFLSLSDALALAASEGVKAIVRCGVELRDEQLRVGLTTTDRDPMVTLKADEGEAERWLGDREQSGPDRWDYHAALAQRHDRYFLRLTIADRFEDVQFEPAALVVLSEHGWGDDVSLTGEACVHVDRMRQSMMRLRNHKGE